MTAVPADAVTTSLEPEAVGRPEDPAASRALMVVAGLAIASGFVMRLWIAVGPLGVLNADETIAGLMARDLLNGNVTAFFWGQAYGGTLEVTALAALMAVFGDSVAIVMLPLLEVTAIGGLLFAISRRHLDAHYALSAVGLFAVAPASAVWFGTRPMLFYNPVVIFGLAAILLVEQLADPGRGHRDRLVRFGAIGLVLGLGWWTSAQILFFAVPVLYSLLRHRRIRSIAEGMWLLGGAVLGAGIWIAYNLRNNGQSLSELPASDGSVADHVRAQVERGWPMIVGARRPFDERWLLPGGGWVLFAIVVAAAVAIGLMLWRHPSLRTPLAGVPIAFFVLHAFAPTGSFVGNGRYYYFVVPALAYLTVAALSRSRPVLTALVLIGAAVVTTTTLASMRDLQFGPTDAEPVTAALAERGVSDVYTDYWVGYPLAWADSELTVTTNHTDRRPDWAARVRNADMAAYVFWLPYADDAQRYARLEAALLELGVEEIVDIGDYRIVIPSTNVPPERLADPNR